MGVGKTRVGEMAPIREVSSITNSHCKVGTHIWLQIKSIIWTVWSRQSAVKKASWSHEVNIEAKARLFAAVFLQLSIFTAGFTSYCPDGWYRNHKGVAHFELLRKFSDLAIQMWCKQMNTYTYYSFISTWDCHLMQQRCRTNTFLSFLWRFWE